MQVLSSSELRFHYQRKMSQIEEEMRRCQELIRTLVKLTEESREGSSARQMQAQLQNMEKQQLAMITDMNDLIQSLTDVL